MSWVKIDDKLPEHPKFFATSCRDRALTCYIIALCYCSRNLTDGVIPKDVLHASFRGAKGVCESMVQAGLLTQNGRSYVVKDYLEWNRSKEEVKEIQEKRRRAGQAGGQASWLARAERLSEAKANPDTDTDKRPKDVCEHGAKDAPTHGIENESMSISALKTLDLKTLRSKHLSETGKEQDPQAVAMSTLLHTLIAENFSLRGVGVPASFRPESWVVEIERAHRIDGYSWADIEKVIRWCQQDDFWSRNILSGKKLRKQLPRLLMEVKEPKRVVEW